MVMFLHFPGSCGPVDSAEAWDDNCDVNSGEEGSPSNAGSTEGWHRKAQSGIYILLWLKVSVFATEAAFPCLPLSIRGNGVCVVGCCQEDEAAIASFPSSQITENCSLYWDKWLSVAGAAYWECHQMFVAGLEETDSLYKSWQYCREVEPLTPELVHALHCIQTLNLVILHFHNEPELKKLRFAVLNL